MADEIAIKVEGVSKDFSYARRRAVTVKSAFTGALRRKTKDEKTIQHALKDISFEVKKGEFFGIVGRNGSGKSTLLKMLAGIYQPNEGKVSVHGKLVPFIELGVGFNPELTGRENVYMNGALLGFSEKEVGKFYNEVVEFAELEQFMDKKLKNYSSGMQVRLAFSMAIRAKADILLIDEVLAVGDADFQRKCFNYFKQLKRDKKTVVFVSHDMSSVREYCDRCILIDDGGLVSLGDAWEVSQEYTKLFMHENQALQGGVKSSMATRWGDGRAVFGAIAAKTNGKNIDIKSLVELKDNIDKLQFGVHVFGTDGKELVATNNSMIQAKDIVGAKKGDIYNIDWQILNVFNDGEYTITVTLVDDVGMVLEWYEQAAGFVVNRTARSTTSIMPPMSVSVRRHNERNTE